MLESQESLPSSLNGSPAVAPPPKALRKLHAESYAALTPSTLRVPFALDIPSDGSPAFECVCAPPDAAFSNSANNIGLNSTFSGSATTPATTNTSTPGGLAWTVRLCLLVCVASPYARAGVSGLRLKHLVRDGVQGEWGSSWKPTRGIAPLQNVDLRKERRAAALGASNSGSGSNLNSNTGGSGSGGQGQGRQRGWASYLLSTLLTPHEREYHDGDEADTDSDLDSEIDVSIGERRGKGRTDPNSNLSHGHEEAHSSTKADAEARDTRGGLEDSEERMHTRTIRSYADAELDLGAAGTAGVGAGDADAEGGWSELRTETVECTVPVVVLPGNTMFRPLEVVFDV